MPVEIYLVGGAVRDQLLGREVTERDYVVVGATPEEMLQRGFRSVGKDFPVFLHPDTNEEYALARTERKTGKGYTGFDCFADPSVTLEQDLLRRDLTINAMAQHEQGKIIDPYGGQADLKAKILRHVSAAFNEDPVRILRVARFAARFPDFTVHPDTNDLMISMVDNGEVDALVAERVWKEMSRALTEKSPIRFFEVLNACEALEKLMPELLDIYPILEKSTLLSTAGHLRFAAFSLDLTVAESNRLNKRLKPPTQFSELSKLVAAHSSEYNMLDLTDAEAVIEFLEKLDAYRRPERFADFCLVAELLLFTPSKPATLQQALELTSKIDTMLFIQQGLQGKAIGEAVHKARVEILNLSYNSNT